MKKVLALFIFTSLLVTSAYSQTMHSLIFVNKKEVGREVDRTAEMNNMKDFCMEIANALGYYHNLRTHSDNEFTSKVLEQEISNLNVKENDIVVFYYAGHGCNWDDDDWPHMCLLDRQYWESTAYTKLKEKTRNAKLMLCIASCCNMDSEGRRREQNGQYYSMDRYKVRELFLGFNGKRSIKISSSIRGQYTWSWTSGSNPGSIFSISLREIIRNAVSTSSNASLTWESILDATKRKTLEYTNNKQLPQYKIEDVNVQRKVPNVPSVQNKSTSKAEAKIQGVYIEHNKVINGTKYMAIHVKFETHYMTEYGGRLVAFFEMPKGTGVKDLNGKYRTTDGKVSVGLNFGSHYIHSSYSDKVLLIPNSEIHPVAGKHTYYIKVGVYDNQQKKYITFSDYVTFKM